MRLNRAVFFLATTLFAVTAAAPASATPITYSGNVSGAFSAPVTSGVIIDGATAVQTFMDNSATAIVIIGTDGPGEMRWGTQTPGVQDNNYSRLAFLGASFSNVAVGQEFLLGTMFYFNGTSSLDSLIFGATFTLSTDNPDVNLKTSNLGIYTTSNTGTAAQNADFVTFAGLNTSFNVFEGVAAAVDIYGVLVNDPDIDLTRITVDPIFPNNAFIGNGVADFVPAPEPATFALVGAGLALVVLRRRPRA